MSLAMLLGAAEAEPSKTAFYVIGGLLAGWAVLVAAAGILRREFPSSRAATGAVMGISVMLVLATMASSILTS